MRVDHDSSTTVQLLHFIVQDVHMCAYLKNIEKVLPLVALENVPGGPSYLAGLMNMKGKMISVIDLAIRTGLTRNKKYSLDTPVLLCSNGQEEIAMIVDDILGLINTEETQFQLHKDFNKPDSPFIASLAHDLDSSLLININYLLKMD